MEAADERKRIPTVDPPSSLGTTPIPPMTLGGGVGRMHPRGSPRSTTSGRNRLEPHAQKGLRIVFIAFLPHEPVATIREQHVERRERPVTLSDILLQLDLLFIRELGV